MTELRHDPALELRLDTPAGVRSLIDAKLAGGLGVRGSSVDDPSGALRAQEAHDAGAVEPLVVAPMHTATLELRLHGPGRECRELVDAIAERLHDHPMVVPPIVVSVVER